MVRPGLRRSEIDWENVDIHISREEMEREQEHEAAIQQAKQYLIKNFPKFCTINNGYYETETFNHDAGMPLHGMQLHSDVFPCYLQVFHLLWVFLLKSPPKAFRLHSL